MSTLLTVENLSKIYTLGGGLFGPGRELVALNDINLTVEAGETLAIVGERAVARPRWAAASSRRSRSARARCFITPKRGSAWS